MKIQIGTKSSCLSGCRYHAGVITDLKYLVLKNSFFFMHDLPSKSIIPSRAIAQTQIVQNSLKDFLRPSSKIKLNIEFSSVIYSRDHVTTLSRPTDDAAAKRAA